ncbi:MAG: cupin domain-containing protein [Gemmatimonadota bacterium]|nr:cupin domain-containing protein [Gemmatimonadota bacterium]
MRRPMQWLPVVTCVALLAACETRDVQSVNAADTLDASARPARAVRGGDTSATDAGGPEGERVSSNGEVEYHTAAELARVGDSLARTPSSGHVLRSHGSFQYLQIRRANSGVPEVHDRWTDVTVVQAGRASLLSGGKVSGSHLETAGEHRGGSIAGGTSRPVGAGDLMIIPAGIPHQYVIASGDSLRYLTVKVLATPAAH